MKYFMKNDSIKELTLSGRTYNTLMRVGITTINQLLALSIDDLESIKNLGQKGYEEIEQTIRNIKVIDKNNLKDKFQESEQQTFLGNDGKRYKDVEISELQLSNRAWHFFLNINLTGHLIPADSSPQTWIIFQHVFTILDRLPDPAFLRYFQIVPDFFRCQHFLLYNIL